MSSRVLLQPWPRAWLFTPADDQRKLDAALASDAEVVIADLEDAVAPARKDLAREQAIALLGAGVDGAGVDGGAGPMLVIRINDPHGEHGVRDLEALTARAAVDVGALVMVPKATLETVALTRTTGAAVVALIETPQGLVESESIALVDGVVALAIGTVDLAAELGLDELPDGLELLYARSRIVVASALGGIPALDGVQLNLDDSGELRAAAERARALGFAGKLCIHPRQLGSVREAFIPTAAELQRARDVVADYERLLADGRGVAASGGEMQDAATVRRARRMLDADSG